MNCPNCNAENMRTTETFKMPAETVRTKMCQVCKWKFTSRETISEDIVIPSSVRNLKSKRGLKTPASLTPLVLSNPCQTSPMLAGQAETPIDGAHSHQLTE